MKTAAGLLAAGSYSTARLLADPAVRSAVGDDKTRTEYEEKRGVFECVAFHTHCIGMAGCSASRSRYCGP